MMAPETHKALPLKSASVMVVVIVTACLSPKVIVANAPLFLMPSARAITPKARSKNASAVHNGR